MTLLSYMLLMYAHPAQTKSMPPGDRDAVARKHEELRAELTKSGELMNGAGLAYPAEATTLLVAIGGPTISVGRSPSPKSSSRRTTSSTATTSERCRSRSTSWTSI